MDNFVDVFGIVRHKGPERMTFIHGMTKVEGFFFTEKGFDQF